MYNQNMRSAFVGVAIIFALTLSYGAFEAYSYQSLFSKCIAELNLSNRVVTVYFDTTNSARLTTNITEDFGAITDVVDVAYQSADDVQKAFIQRHEGDSDIVNAVKELGANPFGATVTLTFASSQDIVSAKDRIESDIKRVALQYGAVTETIDTNKAVRAAELQKNMVEMYSFVPSLMSGHYWLNKGTVQGCSMQAGLF